MADEPMSLVPAFDDLNDPRARRRAHQFDELLLAAICAVISAAESWAAVVEWSEAKLDWLRQQLPFANGIASRRFRTRVLVA